VGALQCVRSGISISVGVADHPRNTRDMLELVAKSDLSLLSAKRLRRFRLVGKGPTRGQESKAIALAH
jgi:hypothetical protein